MHWIRKNLNYRNCCYHTSGFICVHDEHFAYIHITLFKLKKPLYLLLWSWIYGLLISIRVLDQVCCVSFETFSCPIKADQLSVRASARTHVTSSGRFLKSNLIRLALAPIFLPLFGCWLLDWGSGLELPAASCVYMYTQGCYIEYKKIENNNLNTSQKWNVILKAHSHW